MSRFLFTTLASNDLGLLARSLPVAAELAKRGHTIACCNPAAAPATLIAEAGFENLIPKHPLHRLSAANDRTLRGLYRLAQEFGGPLNFLRQCIRSLPTRFPRPTAEMWNLDHLSAVGGMLSENFVRAECEAKIALMADWAPDAVVDSMDVFACMAARIARKPLASLVQADMHPAGRGFIWWKEPPPNLPGALPVVNRVLVSHGLAPIRKMEELLVGDLTLVLGTPETDPLPEEAGATYIGALLWEKAGAKLPEWVNELNGERPIVWVYSGNPRYFPVHSPIDSDVVLRVCIEALANEEAQVVLTTGHHPLPKDVLPLPPNFRHAPYVPGPAMARRCSLMIHHGGYGSCQTGMFTGTPQVIIPTYSERESNARKVAAVGAGEFVLPVEDAWKRKRLGANDLRAAVRRVLSDPSYAANAKRIGEAMRAYGGAPGAARLVEGLVSPLSSQKRECRPWNVDEADRADSR